MCITLIKKSKWVDYLLFLFIYIYIYTHTHTYITVYDICIVYINIVISF